MKQGRPPLLRSELPVERVVARLDKWMTAHRLSIYDIEAALPITYQTVFRARKGNKAALNTTLAWLVFGYGEERVSIFWNHNIDPFNPYMEALATLANDIRQARSQVEARRKED